MISLLRPDTPAHSFLNRQRQKNLEMLGQQKDPQGNNHTFAKSTYSVKNLRTPIEELIHPSGARTPSPKRSPLRVDQEVVINPSHFSDTEGYYEQVSGTMENLIKGDTSVFDQIDKWQPRPTEEEKGLEPSESGHLEPDTRENDHNGGSGDARRRVDNMAEFENEWG